MTKQELMETYTAEQLAEVVKKLDNENTDLKEKLLKKTGLCGEAKVSFDLHGIECCCGGHDIAVKKNKELQSEINKCCKALENTKKERDCQIVKYQKKIEGLTVENEKLKGDAGSEGYLEKMEKTNNFYGIYAYSAKNLTKDDVLLFLGILTKELVENGINFNYDMENGMKVYDMTIEGRKTLTDFLPTEPIKVVDMLINAEGEYEHSPLERAFLKEDKGTYRIFDIGELRQIAKHLLVYCNHNMEVENDKI